MKDEDSTKVKIDTKIDFTILDNENLQIVTSHQSAFNDVVAAHQVEVMRLKDEGVRQALLKMGWTPPGQMMAPSIHEDNARTLQGVIDNVRVTLGVSEGESLILAARRLASSAVPEHLPFSERLAIADAACADLTDETNKIIAATLAHLRAGA